MDGASIHNGVTGYLNRFFGRRWFGRFSNPIPWPARSPDLNPMDFFYWGHVKNELYKLPVMENVPELIQNVLNISGQITEDVINRVLAEFEDRLTYCTAQGGAQFEHILRSGRKAREYIEVEPFEDDILQDFMEAVEN